jgi:Flp pilus assembly CpaF family ATPase
MDYLPKSYVPGEDMRDLRTIVRHIASLVRLRTSIKNALLALRIPRRGLPVGAVFASLAINHNFCSH